MHFFCCFPKIVIARCFFAKLENGVNGRNPIFPFQHLENTRRQELGKKPESEKDVKRKLENVKCCQCHLEKI